MPSRLRGLLERTVLVERLRVVPAMCGLPYVSFDDPASGSGADAWTKAIGHREGDRVVLDALRAWVPPFNPSGVIAESAALSKAYGLYATTGDRYAPGFVLEGFRTHGLTYRPSVHDRSALYLELLPLLNAGCVRLLDSPDRCASCAALSAVAAVPAVTGSTMPPASTTTGRTPSPARSCWRRAGTTWALPKRAVGRYASERTNRPDGRTAGGWPPMDALDHDRKRLQTAPG